MARLIQKTGFISRKSAGGYMKYIATREGVEVLTGKGPATEKQKEMVAKLLKDFPDVRDSFEYEDYKQAPTLHTASALISAALDSHMQNLQSENGYLKYIATRPGAEKHGVHGLFGREENADLNTAMHALTAHGATSGRSSTLCTARTRNAWDTTTLPHGASCSSASRTNLRKHFMCRVIAFTGTQPTTMQIRIRIFT